jgi:hypothetical protein
VETRSSCEFDGALLTVDGIVRIAVSDAADGLA